MGLPEMKPPEMYESTKSLINVLLLVLVVCMFGFVFWLGTRESNRWQVLQDRAEQAEAQVNQMKTAAPGAYTLIPTAEIQCEEPADGYCRRYKVYRLTGID